MHRRFGAAVTGAMILGAVAGAVAHAILSPARAADFAGGLVIVTDAFLRLIRMIIAPLVLTTLVAGVARLGDAASVGRVGVKALSWFLLGSLLSLAIGSVMAGVLHPGVGLGLPLPAGVPPAVHGDFSARTMVTHIVPASIAQAMADNEILQIVVFAVFVGTAVGSLGPRAEGVLVLTEQLAGVMLRVTNYVMLLAPVAIFAALAGMVATQGPSLIVAYAAFVGGFYLSLGVLWAALCAIAFLVLGRRVGALLRGVRQPMLVAFSTASSEAAYPALLERLEACGVPNRIASFVLPLGYSFNLDGAMMYSTFAFLFIVQAYGQSLSPAQHGLLVAFLLLTSKGIAGVPRAALVVITAALSFFKMPEAGILLVVGVDHLLDMGRSATNIVGNALASGVVAKWEGALATEA